jgi:hypothetical protein
MSTLNPQDWQGRLSPNTIHWQGCLQHLRAARLRRAIADEIPLHMAPVIAAYLATHTEATNPHLGSVTMPLSTIKMHNPYKQGE